MSRDQTHYDRGDVRYYGRNENVLSPAQRGTTTESGPIPPKIDWTELKAYVCNCCKDNCLNWIESGCTRANECRSCFRVREALLDTTTASTDRQRTPSHGGPTRKPERTPRPRRGRGNGKMGGNSS